MRRTEEGDEAERAGEVAEKDDRPVEGKTPDRCSTLQSRHRDDHCRME